MEEYDYKKDIVASRVGCLGSSDAKILQNVASLGYVPNSVRERLAIAKGLIEPNGAPKTQEMAFGDYIENAIYAHLMVQGEKYESNPLWVSKQYSKENIKLICHPDIVKYDDKTQTIYVYEVKATKFNVKATKETYRPQMFIEFMLAKEIAKTLGKRWNVKLFLVHYDTLGVDTSEDNFTPERLTIHKMNFSLMFDIEKAMNIINEFLYNFNEYYRGDEIDSTYMPVTTQQEFENITTLLVEIKEREKKVEEFKARLFEFMLQNGIKSIKNEAWSVTRVDSSESVSFNYKAFLDDYAKKYPRKAKKLIETYEKRTKRKGYVNIKIK